MTLSCVSTLILVAGATTVALLSSEPPKACVMLRGGAHTVVLKAMEEV